MKKYFSMIVLTLHMSISQGICSQAIKKIEICSGPDTTISSMRSEQFKGSIKVANSEQDAPLTGLAGHPLTTEHVYLKKGETMNFGEYVSIWVTDYCPDTIPVAFQSVVAGWNPLSPPGGETMNNEKRWVSIADPPRPFFLDSYAYPTQWNKRWLNLFLDTKDLEIGDIVHFYYSVCSEATGGPISTYTCILTWTHYLHVIAYPISLISAKAVNGSMRNINLQWNKPPVQYWNLHHYAIVRNDIDTIRIESLSNCQKVQDSIPVNDTSELFLNGVRGSSSYYAIVGYDSTGIAIALSNSLRPFIPDSSFSLISPHDGQVMSTLTPEFTWNEFMGNTYELWISSDTDFTNVTKISGITQHEYMLTDPLIDHLSYYWKVMTSDSIFSNETAWEFTTNSLNLPPGSFQLVSPPDNATLAINPVNFSWHRSENPGDSIGYRFLISKNQSFTDTVCSVLLPDTSFIPTIAFPEDTMLYWKVIAFDSQHDSITSISANKLLIQKDDSPGGFALISPVFCSNTVPIQTDLHPVFIWTEAKNTDLGDVIKYTLYYSTDPYFTNSTIVPDIAGTTFQPIDPLLEDSYYYWKVKATDLNVHETWSWGLPNCFVTNSVDMPPQPFSIIRPLQNQNIPSEPYTFSWENPIDDIYDAHLYYLYISQDSLFSSADTISTEQSNSRQLDLPSGNYHSKVKCNSKSLPLGQGLGCFEYTGSSYSSDRIFHISDTIINNIYFTQAYYGTDTLEVSLFYHLFWNNLNVSLVRIEFSFDNGHSWEIYKDSVPNQPDTSNSFLVRIPDIITMAFMVRITAVDNPRAFDISPPLIIRHPVKQITIVQPNGNDSLKATSPYQIMWTKHKVDSVSIYLSLDNGKTWNLIVEKTGSTFHQWIIPDTPSDSCLLKVQDIFFPSVVDISDNPFIIFPVRVIHVSAAGNDSTGNGTEQFPFASIQKAVNESKSFDTIKISEGIYLESIVFPEPSQDRYWISGGYNSATWAYDPVNNKTIINAQNNEGIHIRFSSPLEQFSLTDIVVENASTAFYIEASTTWLTYEDVKLKNLESRHCNVGFHYKYSGLIMDRCKIEQCTVGVQLVNIYGKTCIISN